MNNRQMAQKFLLLIFFFMAISQVLYTYQNVRMFRSQYNVLTDEQAKELGEFIQKQLSYGLKYNIPLERLGKVNDYLNGILKGTPDLSFIDIIKDEKLVFTAAKSRDSIRKVEVLIAGKDDQVIASIQLGISMEVDRHSKRMLFDLCTIVLAVLILTYELLLFFASRFIYIPGKEAVVAANTQLFNLTPLNHGIKSFEFYYFLSEIGNTVEITRQKLFWLVNELKKLSLSVEKGTQKDKIIELINRQKKRVNEFAVEKKVFRPIIHPSHARPIVFTFILAANLHSSFLPLFAKDLLKIPTFLSGMFSETILMGLPISAYMISVALSMIVFGTGSFKNMRPFTAISLSLLLSFIGFIFCGISQNIIHLILARTICASGLALITLHCRQFVVDHSSQENVTFYLAGYTTAFAGGMFCSIVLGGIIADYFNYRIVYFFSAFLLLFVFIFTFSVFSNKEVTPKKESVTKGSFAIYFNHFIKDRNAIAITLHGVVTRMIFVGFLYYSIPIFLKERFSFSDIGRIMMLYGLTCIFLPSFLNRNVKKIKQSVGVILASNNLLGLVLVSFIFIKFDTPLYMAIAASLGTIALGISNSVTFPSQIKILLNTQTVKQVGSHTPMAVYQSLEKVGSALGPVVFGALASYYGINKAIGMGGALYLANTIIFYILCKNLSDDKESV